MAGPCYLRELRGNLKQQAKELEEGQDHPLEMIYRSARDRWGDGWEMLSYEQKEAFVAAEALKAIAAEPVSPDENMALFHCKQFAGAAFQLVHQMDSEDEEDDDDGTK